MRRTGLIVAPLAVSLLAGMVLGYCPARTSAEKKMMPEELISRHLESIATVQDRASIKNRNEDLEPAVFTIR